MSLNVLVTGNCHSGVNLLLEALDQHPLIYGKVPPVSLSDCIDEQSNERSSLEQFITHCLIDKTEKGEIVTLLPISYSVLQKADLWDYLATAYLAGDFCMLHVHRNPIECFIIKEKHKRDQQCPELQRRRIELDVERLTKFVRNSLANEAKLERVMYDRADLEYMELVSRSKATLKEIQKYLSLSSIPGLGLLTDLSQRKLPLRYVSNRYMLEQELPHDILDQLKLLKDGF